MASDNILIPTKATGVYFNPVSNSYVFRAVWRGIELFKDLSTDQLPEATRRVRVLLTRIEPPADTWREVNG